MRYLFLLIAILYLVTYSHAQIKIQGSVNDEGGKSFEFASISLLNSIDSGLVEGTLTDTTGKFNFENILPGSYILLGSFIGYEDTYTKPFKIEPDNKLITIELVLKPNPINLKETVITAKKPFLEQKADRLVVNVANSVTAAGGTAMQILQKVPGVIIIQDKVTLKGSQNLQIWIDGKSSPYTDMNTFLKNMPGNMIEKIELISHPGAQFDASGGPILNIILKKNINIGFKGTIDLTLGNDHYDQSDVNAGNQSFYRVNPNANLTYRKGKINLFTNFGINQGDYFDVYRIERLINDQTYFNKNYVKSDYKYSYLRFGSDYYLNPKTTSGVVFRTWKRTGKSNSNNLTEVTNQQNEIESSFITKNSGNSHKSGTYANFYTKHEFNSTDGHSLNFDIDFNQFKSNDNNTLTIFPVNDTEKKSFSDQVVSQPTNIWVGKLDYVYPVDTSFKLSTGLKSSFARVNNVLDFYRNFIKSDAESNNFIYRENINAAYASINKTYKKLEFNAGLRGEQTIVNGESLNQSLLKRNYFQLFPSASALYKINENIGVQAAYSKRVNRPGFSQQNPFSFFIDSLTYTRGNPKLRPEISNNAQLNLLYDHQPFIGFSYSITNDVIIENAPKIEGTKTFTVAENLAEQRRIEIQVNFPIKLGKIIDGFGSNQFIYNSYNANYLGTEYSASKWNYLLYCEIGINLPLDFKFEINGFYMTRFLEEFLVIEPLSAVNLGVSKSFFNERFRVNLNASDVFYQQKTQANISYNDVNVNFFQREYSRNIRLSLSYQFGNTKLNNNKKRSSASESETSRIKID